MKLFKTAAITAVLALAAGPVLAAADSASGQVNINKASKEELMKGIKGLTAAQADAIITHRNKQGVLVNLHELHYLGIGREVIEPNYNNLTVGGVSNADKKNM